MFPLRVTQTDVETFTVAARTSNCHCFWRINLDIIDPDGRSQTVTVDDDGEPFELTSVNNAKDKTFLPRSGANDAWPR